MYVTYIEWKILIAFRKSTNRSAHPVHEPSPKSSRSWWRILVWMSYCIPRSNDTMISAWYAPLNAGSLNFAVDFQLQPGWSKTRGVPCPTDYEAAFEQPREVAENRQQGRLIGKPEYGKEQAFYACVVRPCSLGLHTRTRSLTILCHSLQ